MHDEQKFIIDSINPSILKSIEGTISRKLDKAALFYRLFFRLKTPHSTKRKLSSGKYNKEKKIQDMVGGRIILYFIDDIPICRKLIEQLFTVVDISEDPPKEDEFKPARLNYVCKLTETDMSMFHSLLWDMPIDNTFEIQVRTIFSEGWHEVEHDLRYKCKEEWKGNEDLSRNLNGILATLETCDWAIINIFEDLSHRKYKTKMWDSLLRNKLRIRFADSTIGSEILNIVNDDVSFWKNLLRINREKFLITLASDAFSAIPKTFDNIIYCANEMFIHYEAITAITPEKIKNDMEIFNKNIRIFTYR